MTKKLIILALCLVLTAFAVSNLTACDSKGLEYLLLDNDTYAVIGIGECEDLDIVIPSEHEGKKVTVIDEKAFEGCDEITSITIPDTVTDIMDFAFAGCEALVTVTIPDSIKTIRSYAFNGCDKLTVVNITDLAAWCDIYFYDQTSNPVYFAHKLYLNDESVNELVIPDGVKEIPRNAFVGFNRLTGITLPDSVTKIGSNAFSGCTRLETVTLSESLVDLGINVFEDCKKLTYTEYENGNYLGSRTNPYFLLASVTKSASTPTVHPDTKVLGDSVFKDLDTLTEITLPEGLVAIGPSAFNNCAKLTSVTLGSSVKTVGIMAFMFCSSLETVTLPDGLETIGASAFYWCGRLSRIVIPNSVTTVSREAFSNCSTLSIFCEAAEQPEGFDEAWNSSNCPVEWGYQGK